MDTPCVEAMEAIGGTGDTLTGILTALCAADFALNRAAILASLTNCWSGRYAAPSPATQISELIDKIPQALSKALHDLNSQRAG
ncbi:MAG: hypothetical protein ACK5PS_18660 [Desulfopila sp.]